MPMAVNQLHQEILGAIRASALEDEGQGAAATAATVFHSWLHELGAAPAEFHVCELQLDGYSVPVGAGADDEEDERVVRSSGPQAKTKKEISTRLNVFALVGKPGANTIRKIEKSDIALELEGVINFLTAAHHGAFDTDAFESHPIQEFIDHIRPSNPIQSITISILALGRTDTNSSDVANNELVTKLSSGIAGAPKIVIDIWDYERLQTESDRDARGGTLTIDVEALGHRPIDCIAIGSQTDEYRTYLAAIPGDVLADIFYHFGDQLLERNVRSFLQARGKINKGIQNTLASHPKRFLAYNNGVTVTASDVEMREGKITQLVDFQIVNGGQTTGSLYWAKHRADPRINLSDVVVQAKISVVNLEKYPNFVADVARYSNSQNRIRESDFASALPLHEQLHKLGRSAINITPEGTSWFYERTRGEYANEVARRTGSNRQTFERKNPKSQLMTKLDLGRSLNCWDLHPEDVCKGAEKSLAAFTSRFNTKPKFEVSDQFFRDTVAKFIILKSIDRAVAQLALGAYKSQTVAHTYSVLRHLMLNEGVELDLDLIWELGALPDATLQVVQILAPKIRQTVIADAGDQNIAEWAKKPECHSQLMNNTQIRKLKFKTKLRSESRSAVEDSGWAVTEILRILSEAGRLMGRNEIQAAAGGKQVLSTREWEQASKFLVETGQVEKNGRGPGTTYRVPRD